MECERNNMPIMGLIGIVAHKIIQSSQDKYKEVALNKSQAGILFALYRAKSMSQKDLAHQLNVTPPSITSAIQKMEKAGYLTRETDANDQRVMRLSLTEKGESCIEGVKKVASEMEELILYGMSAEEKMLFRRLMLQIYENLEQEKTIKKYLAKKQ